MILLDTNIISELMKTLPSQSVLSWLDEQEASQVVVTTISVAEIAYGIYVLPDGKRREALEIAFNKTIKEAFKHRVFSFDETAAHLYGKIMSHRKKLGRPLSILDGQIAAIAAAQNAILATRNIKDFLDCELKLINPFE